MENYSVTVITVYRNDDLDLFAKCLDPMTRQTADFEKIEWIIVLHNTDKAHSDGVKKLVREYANIKLLVLNDYTVTSAAARNLGIESATAPYIMFLDISDSLYPQCAQTVLSHIKGTLSQLAWFRKEFVTEDAGSVPAAEIVLWNQTYDEIVVGKDDIRDSEMLFSGECGSVTGRIFDREFLNDNNIRFDTDIAHGEELMFILECCGKADRICCLPQLIGYRSRGLRRQYKNDAPSLISAANGYKKIFDAGQSYGLYMNDIISCRCFELAQRITTSSRLSTKDRQKIKDILGAYVENMVPRKVSKLCSAKTAKEMYEFARAVILNPESYTGDYERYTLIPTDTGDENGFSEYQRLLRDILDLNGNTDFGERYGFNEINTLTEYQTNVPVSGYDMYAPLLALQTNIGESGILTSDRVRSYVLDLGSMDNPRLIPCTDRQLASLKELLKNAVTGEKTFLLLESYPRAYKYSDNAVVNTVYGALLSDVFADESVSVYAKRAMFTAPAELLFPETVADMTYLRLLFALSERFVKQIIAPNTWELWETFRFLEKNWRDLCADIEAGSPDHFTEVISDEYREIIKSSLIPDPGRAQELAEIFGEGFDTPVMPRIWRKLSKIYAFVDGTYGIYSAGLERYIGEMKLSNGFFASSAALIGTETDIPGYYRLEASNTFTEFVPTDGADDVSAFDVVPGRDYYLQITTYSGLYRYRLGDVVRIERLEGDVPVFSYRYSGNDTVKLGECSVTDELVGNAVFELRQSGAPVTDYAYLLNDAGDGITVLLEIWDDDISGLSKNGLSEQLEKLLEEQDSSYRSAAAAEKIKPVNIGFIEQETQLLYRDILMNRLDRPSDLIKPVRYINSPIKENFFVSRIIK